MIPVLTTERLILRPHRAEDFDAVAAMTGDAEVMRYIGGKPQPQARGLEDWRFARSNIHGSRPVPG